MKLAMWGERQTGRQVLTVGHVEPQLRGMEMREEHIQEGAAFEPGHWSECDTLQ